MMRREDLGVAVVALLPFPDEEQSPALGPANWSMTHHDEGDPSRPAHRVSARLQRAQKILSRWRVATGNAVEGMEWERDPGDAQLVEMARLPSSAELPSAGAWLPGLEILMGLRRRPGAGPPQPPARHVLVLSGEGFGARPLGASPCSP
ncbi:conserved hypothetical protein [Micrococcus luteus]|nr:conserved hypothetical protein [Micrococcus luteus]VXB30119.1 conserved hypothetical protein [Micrococcus luteus]